MLGLPFIPTELKCMEGVRNVNKLPVAGVKNEKKEKRSQLVKPLHLRLAEDVRKKTGFCT